MYNVMIATYDSIWYRICIFITEQLYNIVPTMHNIILVYNIVICIYIYKSACREEEVTF